MLSKIIIYQIREVKISFLFLEEVTFMTKYFDFAAVWSKKSAKNLYECSGAKKQAIKINESK